MTPLTAYRDDGPVASLFARDQAPTTRLGWMTPALLRLLEYGAVLLIVRWKDPVELPLAFALLGAVAFHQYDIVYRQRHRSEFLARWVTFAGLGWELRVAAVAALAALDALHTGLTVMTLWLAVLFVGESVSSWLRATAAPGVDLQGDE
jgi:hypothetical protein